MPAAQREYDLRQGIPVPGAWTTAAGTSTGYPQKKGTLGHVRHLGRGLLS
jgi:hypothetical protein